MPDLKKNILETPADVALHLAEDLKKLAGASAARGRAAHVSLSGGNTPQLLYHLLAEKYAEAVSWENLHFWWGDERCVPPEDADSNFGAVKALLLDHIAMPAENVHRMMGEAEPEGEAGRYGSEMLKMVPLNAEGIPVFHWHILGMGSDGHTASLFPKDLPLDFRRLTLTAEHPESGQMRISLGAGVLCAAERTTVIVTGKKKSDTLQIVLAGNSAARSLPVFHVMERARGPEWILDRDAAGEI